MDLTPFQIAEALVGIAAATDADLLPRVVLTSGDAAARISVIECVMPNEDGAAIRGYLWHAVTGDFELQPARIQDYRAVPGRQIGGTLISTSRRSPRAALANARAVLTAQARTRRLATQWED